VINGSGNVGQLWAYDAISLKVLYNTAQAANGRDLLPAIPHFATQMSVNGKVYVGTNSSLVVYGLLP
jgi:hypothetical protein